MITKIISLLLLFGVLWFGGLLWFISLIPAPYAVESSQKADAIVVLTGGALRLERGFELLAGEAAPVMLVSGVEDGVTLASLLHTKEYHDFGAKLKPDSVILGYKARSTRGNAAEVAEWVKKNHIQTILLVTGNYHIPRSEYEIKQAVPRLIIIAEPVFPGHFQNHRWWQHGESLKLVISEYHKYMYILCEGITG